ncbi:MAG: sensor domain-containing diguanylate cyclase [Shinella sp.]|nr:MAG: sensor domain-containing diguanylate cyclase [Shinella sp.]
MLAAAVFAACMLGILTRPIGSLATVWPANAVLLGLLLRFENTSTPAGWAAAFGAYLAADLLTGASFEKAVILNGANMVGVAAAYLVCFRLPKDVRRLRHPSSMLYLALAAVAGSAAAGLVGAIANPVLFDSSSLRGLFFWFSTELVNYITILPVVLAYPDGGRSQGLLASMRSFPGPAKLAPAISLLVSCVAAIMVGGGGAIAFPVPALLWCALSYPVFATSVLTLLFSIWTLFAISAGMLPTPEESTNEITLISVRMGVGLICLAPVMLASVMAAHNDLVARLQHLASNDALTGLSNRRAFREQAGLILQRSRRRSVALLMDLDHFKNVNDTFGHAAGDTVLVVSAQRIRDILRTDDALGRLGGEEFAALLSDCTVSDAMEIAEQIRRAVQQEPIRLDDGREIHVTLSIGLAAVSEGTEDIDILLSQADEALYGAKKNGRNRVAMAA